jgi:hypothetical protein
MAPLSCMSRFISSSSRASGSPSSILDNSNRTESVGLSLPPARKSMAAPFCNSQRDKSNSPMSRLRKKSVNPAVSLMSIGTPRCSSNSRQPGASRRADSNRSCCWVVGDNLSTDFSSKSWDNSSWLLRMTAKSRGEPISSAGNSGSAPTATSTRYPVRYLLLWRSAAG